MRDTTKRDAVMVEFSEISSPFGSEREERMADEIVRLRQRAKRAERILAALREPSSNVIESANVAFPFAAPMIRAAVAAAEQEVGP